MAIQSSIARRECSSQDNLRDWRRDVAARVVRTLRTIELDQDHILRIVAGKQPDKRRGVTACGVAGIGGCSARSAALACHLERREVRFCRRAFLYNGA